MAIFNSYVKLPEGNNVKWAMLTSLLWCVLNVGFKKWLSPTWQVSLTWVALIIQPRLPPACLAEISYVFISHHYNPLKKRLWAFKQPYVDGFSSIFQHVHPFSSMFDLLPFHDSGSLARHARPNVNFTFLGDVLTCRATRNLKDTHRKRGMVQAVQGVSFCLNQ